MLTIPQPATVYRILNLKNGNFYIGITKNSLSYRKSQHLSASRKGIRGRLYNAIRKHGENNFKFNELMKVEDYLAAQIIEMQLINDLSPPYNVTFGGEGVVGYKHNKESRKKISDAVIKSRIGKKNHWIGRKHNPEALEKMSKAKLGSVGHWRGKKRAQETIEKLRKHLLANPRRYWLGKKRPQETIDKIKKSKIGCKAPPVSDLMTKTRGDNMRRAALARRKKVICVTNGKIFESAREASRFYGFEKTSVASICNSNGKRKTIYGLEFKYMEKNS